MIKTVVDMGFPDKELVKRALLDAKGSYEQVVTTLTSQNIQSCETENMISKAEEVAKKAKEKLEEQKSRKEAADRMEKEIGDADGYLDLTLEEEKEYMEIYRNILGL